MMRLYYDILTEPTSTLIAGTTGSGKSVIMNGLISSLLTCDLKDYDIILCDPKKVEFAKYKKVRSCIKYGNSPESIVDCLEFAHRVMMRRYKYMERHRQIEFGGAVLYVFVDEIADLLLNRKYSKKINDLLQSIAQLGRASRVRLIIATQSPSRKILNSSIQVNFVSRVGLRCQSKIESRQVINATGLETLPRWGYCIRTSPSIKNTCYTVPMLSDAEIYNLISKNSKKGLF